MNTCLQGRYRCLRFRSGGGVQRRRHKANLKGITVETTPKYEPRRMNEIDWATSTADVQADWTSYRSL